MNQIDRLKTLDNDKLIDVVKNYRQYGYDEELRTKAMLLLEERGILKDQLELTGNFENKEYDNASEIFNSFTKNSKIAFILYGIILITNMLTSSMLNTNESIGIVVLVLGAGALPFFIVFVIRSFINQSKFYKAIGQEYGTEGTLLYLFFGIPIYIFMYFFFRNQMKEKMKEIK